MDGDAGHLAPHELALSGVQPRADLQPDLANGVADRAGAANPSCRPIERSEEPVAGRVRLVTSEALELATEYRDTRIP